MGSLNSIDGSEDQFIRECILKEMDEGRNNEKDFFARMIDCEADEVE